MKKEIKDIQYFLDKENEYISKHNNVWGTGRNVYR